MHGLLGPCGGSHRRSAYRREAEPDKVVAERQRRVIHCLQEGRCLQALPRRPRAGYAPLRAGTHTSVTGTAVTKGAIMIAAAPVRA
jgi:hypothetical protein